MKNSQKYFTGLAVVVMVLMVGTMFGQPAGGPPLGGAEPSCWPPPCIPIDGGMSFLIAAGIALGGKKLLSLRSK